MFKRSRFRQRFETSEGLGLGTVVAPFFLATPFVLTRTQASGAKASGVSREGVVFYEENTPRFVDPSSRLLMEGQQTNAIGNPRCEGAVAGLPGTMPTNWTVGGNGQGLTWNVVGTGTENGLPYVDLRLSGTSSGTANARVTPQIFLPAGTAAQNEVWTSSFYIQRIAGSLTGISACNLYFREFTSGVVFLGARSIDVSSLTASLLASRRVLTDTVLNATAGIVDMSFQIFPFAGVAVDVTFRLAAPYLRQNGFADTDIFPVAGTPGASTRSVDLISASLADLGISANGASTVLWSGLIPAFVTGGVHTIACLDDGSVNNCLTMRVDQASGQLQAQRSLAGASTTANAGAVTANVAFKAGMAIDGSGRAAVSLNGSAVAAVTGGPSSGLTTARLGNISDGSAPMFGETLRFQIFSGALSDADLQTATGALP